MVATQPNGIGGGLILRYLPPKLDDFFHESFMATARHEERFEGKLSPFIFLFSKDDRTMTSGWQRAPYFRRNGRESAGFTTGNFVKERLGGLS